MPNVRDHDASVYLRLQGDALSVGGYESNPIFWEEVSCAPKEPRTKTPGTGKRQKWVWNKVFRQGLFDTQVSVNL